MKILIGGAWPYANGSLHIGHIAGLLSGDVIARYHRAKGDDVYFVSGSDCYGTPVAVRAKQEGISPSEISDHYHEEFCECFKKLGFSYDGYGKTTADAHKDFVKDFHRTLYDSEYIYEKSVPQAYCEGCESFLADRYVNGLCPRCGEKARGDQCEACGSVLEPETLVEPKCAVCGKTPVFKESTHLFIAITRMEEQLRALVDANPYWRKNAIAFTNRYINEGLRDRAVTRDLDWGIEVPKQGYEDKRIYIWAENVLGYLSVSKQVCEARDTDFGELWGENARHYYVHGKDNIPFHTIILPALLFAHDNARGRAEYDASAQPWHLPDMIVSSEYMTIEGRKISTSQNHAIWIKDVIDTYDADSLRYFMIANGPERRDADFTWREYINSHNGELLGAYGNFVNRNLAFVVKYLDGVLPAPTDDTANAEGGGDTIKTRVEATFKEAGELIEQGNLRDALDRIFELVRYGNKYFDENKPWETRHTDIKSCNTTIYNCVYLVANLAAMLTPFLPFSSEKVAAWLDMDLKWQPRSIAPGYRISETPVLFQRIAKEK